MGYCIVVTKEGGKRIRLRIAWIGPITATTRKNGSVGSMINMTTGGTIMVEQSPGEIDTLIRRERDQFALAF